MTALSLFSGIGGMDLAAEAAGIKTAAMCEIDPFCRKVLANHWPDVPIYDDIFKLRGEDIGSVDIIHGGFPCQPFSVAGRKRGQEDERYLWPEFSRLVDEIRPVWVVAENVPGILSLAADDVCKDLERKGYSVGIWNYEAAAVGALHRRARVFFVAHAGCELRPGSIFRGAGAAEAERKYADQPERSGSTCHVVSDSDSTWESQQSRGLSELWEWLVDVTRKNASSECRNRREPQPGMGGMAYGIPCGLAGLVIEPSIPRVARGVKDRTARLRALGNAVVPAHAFLIFRAIAAIEGISP